MLHVILDAVIDIDNAAQHNEGKSLGACIPQNALQDNVISEKVILIEAGGGLPKFLTPRWEILRLEYLKSAVVPSILSPPLGTTNICV